jgi:hypothetical protein
MPPCFSFQLTEPKLTIDPPPFAFMSAATFFAAKNWCLRLTAIPASQLADVVSSIEWRWSLAALLSSTGDRSDARAHRGDRGVERVDVGEVGSDEHRDVARAAELRDERLGGRHVDVDEAHARALRGELLHERHADAGGAARDQHGAVLQAGVACEGSHGASRDGSIR